MGRSQKDAWPQSLASETGNPGSGRFEGPGLIRRWRQARVCLFGGQGRQDLDPRRQRASGGPPQQRGRRAHLSQSRLWICPWAALPVQSEPRPFPGPWPRTAGLPPPHGPPYPSLPAHQPGPQRCLYQTSTHTVRLGLITAAFPQTRSRSLPQRMCLWGPPPHPLQLGLTSVPFPKGAHGVRRPAEATQPVGELPIGVEGTQEPPRRDTCLIQAGHQGVCIPRSLQDVALPSAEDRVSHRP